MMTPRNTIYKSTYCEKKDGVSGVEHLFALLRSVSFLSYVGIRTYLT